MRLSFDQLAEASSWSYSAFKARMAQLLPLAVTQAAQGSCTHLTKSMPTSCTTLS